MSDQEQFIKAYLAALYFTETGEDGQPGPDDKLTPLSQARCWIDARNFWWAYNGLIKASGASPEQAGHDFWLTRNSHGCGFWDRPEIYGENLAQELTRASKACGSFDPDFDIEHEEQPHEAH